jgi:shikimate kinase
MANAIERIYLIGFMGCGKSTMGKALAQSMGWQFADLDDLFEKKHGMTISDFFKAQGEEGFRNAERDMLTDSFMMDRMVLATGGGAPCFFDNMERMNRNGLAIYLKLPPLALVKRLHNGKHSRPLIADKSDDEMLGFITQKLAEREPFYNKATLVIEDDGSLSVPGYVQIIKASIDDVEKGQG